METGKSSDLQEYVIRTVVRSGLKREFVFALKSQAEFSNTHGRTRSSKAHVATPAALPYCGRKSPKLSDDREKQLVVLHAPAIGSVILALPAPMNIDCSLSGGVAVDISAADARKKGYPESALDVSISVHSIEESEKDGIRSKAPILTDGIGELKKDKLAMEKSGTDHRKNLQEARLENSAASALSQPLPLESIAVAPGVSKSPPENGSIFDQSEVLDCLSGSKVSSRLAEKPIRRFTRSTAKLIPAATAPPKTKQEEMSCEVKLIRRFTRSTSKRNLPAAVSFFSIEQENQGKVTPVAEIPVTVQQESLVEIPITNSDGLNFEYDKLDESIKAEHEGSVSVTVISDVDDDNEMYSVAPLEKPTMTPTRRFIRSLLTAAIEETAVADGYTPTNVRSVESEDSKGDDDALNESPSSTSKKKMALKMSKKITLTKFPSNVRELLGTGLLEGLPVKYTACPGKSVGLQGIIRGNGVVCSCTSCQGKRVVSVYLFEIHAGSTKNHPSDFIFLQNGKNLREVLKSCTGASMDMLEAEIQKAIGPLPPRRPNFCRKCQGIGNFDLLCDSCLEPNHQQAIPTPSHGTASSANLPRRVLVPFPSDGTPKSLSSQKKPSYGKPTKKDAGLHKLAYMDDILPQGTEVGYYIRGKRLLEGHIKNSGIFCSCCNSVVSPSQFEAHAGQASRHKPYYNIYTSNGVSLHELSISLSKGRKLSATENDDLCSICADGGDLLLCDLCPRAFHKECIGLSSIPIGDWFCQYCQNLQQKDKCLAKNDNTIAAGRVAGVDPVEQIIKRSICIAPTTENDAGVCALCRQHDFSRFGFDRRTVIICDQCEIEYHVGCLKDHGMADLQVLPKGEWFCRPDCSRIHAVLHDLLRQGAEVLDANIIKKKLDEKGLNIDAAADVRWRLLGDKSDSTDSKVLLSQAISLFRSYHLFTIFLPFFFSFPVKQTDFFLQGYFQSLFSCIESLLKSLEVKHFVLPAADDAESMWTKKFGFAKLTPAQLREYAKGARPIIFQGTSILHKLLISHQELPLSADSGPIKMDLMFDVNDSYFITYKFGGYWIEVKSQNRRKYEGGNQKTVKLEKDKINYFVLREEAEMICPLLRGHDFELHYHVCNTSPKIYKPIIDDVDVLKMIEHSNDGSKAEVVIIVPDGNEDVMYSHNRELEDGSQSLELSHSTLDGEVNSNTALDTIDDEYFICDSEDSEPLSVGSLFQDSFTFKEALRTEAILNNFALKIKSSDKTRVIAICAHHGCPWRVRASVCSDGRTFEVKKLCDRHLCPRVDRTANKHATINWIAHQIQDMVKKDPNITPKLINNCLKSSFGLSLPYMKLWRSRKQARDIIFGSIDDPYRSVPTCLRPGSMPRKRKIKSSPESTKKRAKIAHKCSHCGNCGHHKNTCKNSPHPQMSGVEQAS
ncbi:uncharacterized protein LOC110025141 [Phalaenopsis equestris]|uniref:uncharacterized protein LOC110025141 n=1 Tax=Phalaenopsis equestris TaxID=78828 RepID=UPI0009E56AA1|nr:uncharacterized protein LOC110025141 [Phalaenopsis equestris]